MVCVERTRPTGQPPRGFQAITTAIAAAFSVIAIAGGASAQSSSALAKLVEDWRVEWPATNFAEKDVDLHEVDEGGPPKDGIPAVFRPSFVPALDVVTFSDREAVVSIVVGDEARAYPMRYLIWHEIVNDVVGDIPVLITFCPLCGGARGYLRDVDGDVLTFGVSGKLRFASPILYDRQSQSWWQQITGQAIVGQRTGDELEPAPVVVESWGAFRRAHPDGVVLAQPRARFPKYGENPYPGYEAMRWPFAYKGDAPPDGVAPMARVVRVGERAWPLNRLASDVEIVEDGVRLTWSLGMASPVDGLRVSDGRELGNVRAYDAESGEPLAYDLIFAFAFQAFYPDGRWMLGDGG